MICLTGSCGKNELGMSGSYLPFFPLGMSFPQAAGIPLNFSGGRFVLTTPAAALGWIRPLGSLGSLTFFSNPFQKLLEEKPKLSTTGGAHQWSQETPKEESTASRSIWLS